MASPTRDYQGFTSFIDHYWRCRRMGLQASGARISYVAPVLASCGVGCLAEEPVSVARGLRLRMQNQAPRLSLGVPSRRAESRDPASQDAGFVDVSVLARSWK